MMSARRWLSSVSMLLVCGRLLANMPTNIKRSHASTDPNPTEDTPFGRYGAALLTGHPVGLVIVICLFAVGRVGIRVGRWLLGVCVVLGSIVGLLRCIRRWAPGGSA